MLTIPQLRALASSFPEAEEHPHFEKAAFKVRGKIFATLNAQENRACVKLGLVDQSAFCAYNKEVMYPVPNKWGTHGYTNINLDLVPPEMAKDAVRTAYCTVAPRKLAETVKD